MVSIESTRENCEEMNIAILDFAGLREDLLQDSNNLMSLERAHGCGN